MLLFLIRSYGAVQDLKKSTISIKRDSFAVRRGAGASTVLAYGLAPATKDYTKLAFLQLQSAKKQKKDFRRSPF